MPRSVQGVDRARVRSVLARFSRAQQQADVHVQLNAALRELVEARDQELARALSQIEAGVSDMTWRLVELVRGTQLERRAAPKQVLRAN